MKTNKHKNIYLYYNLLSETMKMILLLRMLDHPFCIPKIWLFLDINQVFFISKIKYNLQWAQITWINQLSLSKIKILEICYNEEIFILSWNICPWFLSPIMLSFWPTVHHRRKQLFTSWQQGSKMGGREASPKPFKGIHWWPNFLSLVPKSQGIYHNTT